MDRAKLSESLRRLGLGADPTAVYLALLELPPGPLAALAAATGLGAPAVCAGYQQLAEVGLVGAVGDGADTAVPLPPEASLEILGRHRAVELDEARLAVAGAFAAFRRQRLSEYTGDVVEAVTGDAIGPRIRHATASVRTEIRRFDSPPYFRSGADNAAEELAQLARGIRHRAVYSRASLEEPGYVTDNVEPCIAAGEQARVVPSVPVKLTIVDDAYALVSLSIAEADVNTTLLVVRPCGLFSALTALFELSWQVAQPLHGADRAARLAPADRRLLALLAAGVSDESIAREIGVSRRTFFRRLEMLMARLGATTRFQLALQAQRRGWL